METKSYEEFENYYKDTNNFLYPLKNWSKKPLTENQLKSKYREYCKKIDTLNNKEYKESEYMQKVNATMRKIHEINDLSYYNNFYDSLLDNEKKILDDNMWLCTKTKGKYVFDGCHYIERSRNSKMAYNIDNIVLLPRYLHNRLDDYLNPFTPDPLPISEEEHHKLWERILGKERIDKLDKINKEKCRQNI